MTTDLPALDAYDAEIVDITVSYSIRISQAEATAAAARRTLADAEATLAELTSERTNAVHQARERLLTATGAEIRDGGIRGKPGRPTRRVEPPALVSPPPDLTDPNVVGAMAALVPASGIPIDGHTPDGVPFGPGAAGGGVVLVGTERPTLPVSVAPTAAEEFIADVSEPERSLCEQGFSREEIATTPIAERWRLKRMNAQRTDMIQHTGGTWAEAPF